MKSNHIFVLLFVVTFCGCTSTSFVAHKGPAVFEGKGGSCRQIKGIDFWEIGEPDRKYQIIGYIEQVSHYDGGDIFETAIVKSQSKSGIVAEARKQGGDAVVFLSRSSQVVGSHSTGTYTTTGYSYKAGMAPAVGMYTTSGTSYSHNKVRDEKKIAVVRYVP